MECFGVAGLEICYMEDYKGKQNSVYGHEKKAKDMGYPYKRIYFINDC